MESSTTVGAGAFQIETSVSYGRTGSGAKRLASWTTPTLLRMGIGNAFEVRVETDGWSWNASADGPGVEEGRSDLAVGFKWQLTDARNTIPSAAILLHADLPSGAESLRGHGVRPSLRAVVEWSLPSGFELGVMPGLTLDRDEGGSFAAGIVGVVIGKPIAGSLRGFAEVSFEQFAVADHGGTVGSFNTGIALLLAENLQLDTSASWGLTRNARDLSWGLGLSVLSPGG